MPIWHLLHCSISSTSRHGYRQSTFEQTQPGQTIFSSPQCPDIIHVVEKQGNCMCKGCRQSPQPTHEEADYKCPTAGLGSMPGRSYGSRSSWSQQESKLHINLSNCEQHTQPTKDVGLLCMPSMSGHGGQNDHSVYYINREEQSQALFVQMLSSSVTGMSITRLSSQHCTSQE